MPSDFTVILDRFVHLGNESGAFGAGDPSLFKGKDFDAPPFSCPNVNPEERAVLFFQSIDVDNTRNVIQINGSNLFGGIPRSSTDSAVSRIWNGNVALVEAN